MSRLIESGKSVRKLAYKNVYSPFRRHSETGLYLFESINRGEKI